MNKSRRLSVLLAGFALICTGIGCQTNIAGMTLPSGYYLQHRPQYFPPEPSFPLSRELATMQAQNQAAAAAEAGAVGRVAPPPAVVPAPPPAAGPTTAPPPAAPAPMAPR